MKKAFIHFAILAMACTLCISCSIFSNEEIEFPDTDLKSENIIPAPLSAEATHSGFPLDVNTSVTVNSEWNDAAEFLTAKIQQKTGLNIPINTNSKDGGVITIKKTKNNECNSTEYYILNINSDTISIQANSEEGAFRGIQTLRQIIPFEANDTIAKHEVFVIPTGKIIDKPQFSYRGTMLDVSRHFFSVTDVKKYIDVLAYYKYNILHLHLTDDQGWRIEIKKWPKLTEIGGSTEVGGEAGGFYTQEDYIEIVEYAAKHHITIVPEFDMPGHTNAASVSYPFLNGNGKTPELYEGTDVGFSTFDTRKDEVYEFIDDVVGEIAAITPGPYFHIGGDESHVTKKDDYLYFVERVEKIVQKHNKRLIGWDEVANADLNSSSVSQFWHSKKNAHIAVKKDMKIILSPAKKAYLDMQYDSTSKHGLHWAGYIPVDTAYNWSPERYAEVPMENILGIEAPLWSETISNISELEYLAFPRVISYAELGWSIEENRDLDNFRQRLQAQKPYLQSMGVNYYDKW